MEDYIYILIGAIWLIFSVVKGNQKKKASMANRTDGDTHPNSRSFEDIMSEILGTNESQQAPQNQFVNYSDEEVIEEVEEVEVGNAYQSLEDLYMKESLENEYEPRIEELIKNRIEPQIKEHKSQKQQFDLRTAIIYQAIMERPYA